MELCEAAAHELGRLMRRREVSAEEVTRAVLARIEEVEEKVRAYLTLLPESALAKAREVDARLARGEELGPLAGVPVAIKDVICTKGVRTTCGSRILESFVPPYNAAVVRMLAAGDVVVVGKTNMDEFAMGSSTENSGFFPTRNPWDLERVPGGSSGGSAAAVAAGEAICALGSDTGGSVRQPAAFCGIVGLKPTYGRVSRYGLVAYASSLDQIGPFARDVTDCALLFEAIAAHDPCDSTSADVGPPDVLSGLGKGVRGKRIGAPVEYFGEGVTAEVKEAVRNALRVFEELGAEIVELSLPHTAYALPAYYLVATAEASSNLARYDGVKYGFRAPTADSLGDLYRETRDAGFGAEVKRRIMLGTYALSAGYYDAYYLKALKVRTLIKRDFERAFGACDLMATPTSPTVAFKVGEKVDDPLTMYLSDICTVTINLAGLPAISIPCGFAEGMPVGLQLIGRPFDEGTILQAAHSFAGATAFHKARPPIGRGREPV